MRPLAQVNADRDRLAEEMAEGCPTLIEAYRRMGINLRTGKRYWQAIRAGLGVQAV